jgi:hypothetical protein
MARETDQTIADQAARLSAYDAFDALFDDEALDGLTQSDELSDRLAELVSDGLTLIEAMMVDGDDDFRLTAILKILPLAVRVLDKRQNATQDRIAQTMRAMFTEIFPDRLAVEQTFDALSDPDLADLDGT